MFFFLMTRRPPTSPLFPYTTLFRSRGLPVPVHLPAPPRRARPDAGRDRKSTRLNSSHVSTSYAVFCLKKKEGIRNVFFSNDTPTTDISTLSLHDALPISRASCSRPPTSSATARPSGRWSRSEEHTSELQSRFDLVCRLLLEKKGGHPQCFFF